MKNTPVLLTATILVIFLLGSVLGPADAMAQQAASSSSDSTATSAATATKVPPRPVAMAPT